VIWVSLYFKWWTLIDLHSLVSTLPLVILAYIAVTAISNLQVLSPWMVVFPLYALVQILIMPPLGAVHYVVLARRRQKLGRYRFGYRRGPVAVDGALAPTTPAA
jgi:hypothetical protein